MSYSDKFAAIGVSVKAVDFTLEQEGFLFRDDDGDEDEANGLANQDTDISRDKDVNTRLRMLINGVAGHEIVNESSIIRGDHTQLRQFVLSDD